MTSTCLQWFAAVDTDRSGRISVNELQEALALGNLHFSLAVCAQMIRSADNLADVQQTAQTKLQYQQWILLGVVCNCNYTCAAE